MTDTARLPGEVRFDHRDDGRDDETWRALPQWRSVPRLRVRDGEAVRQVVVAVAHPDDETLACGGLVARAAENRLPCTVLVATDGEGSHPGSPTHPPAVLAERRRAELDAAVQVLHPGAEVVRLGLPDGGLAGHHADLVAALDAVGRPGTLLVSTWRHDGHADHEAVAVAAEEVAERLAVRHLEAPIWLWHWGEPSDVPWDRCAVLPLTTEQAEVKERALAAYTSQTQPLSAAAEDDTVLRASMLAAFRRSYETYVETAGVPDAAAVFEDLHRSSTDPWRTGSSWYERRKRDLTLALLPRRRVASILEIGCSVGELTAALAARAEDVLGVDVSPAALEAAERRCAGLPVRFERAQVPQTWPSGRYDVVVLSEVGYFLTRADLAETLSRAVADLSPDGAVLLVHWRHPVEGWPLDGAAVHATAERVLARHGLTPATRVSDDDVLLDLYRRAPRSGLAAEER